MNPELLKMRTEWLAKAESADKAGDQSAFDAAMAEVEKIDASAKAEQASADRAARLAATRDQVQAARTVTSAGTQTVATVVSHVRDRVQDDPSRGFRSMGEFADRVMRVAAGDRESMGILAAATGSNQTVPSDGGFLVPPTFSAEIKDLMAGSSDSLLDRTDNYTVEGESLTFPVVADTNRTNGQVAGGVRAYWKSEAAQLTASKPQFREHKIEPNELFVFVPVTDKLLRNSTMALNQFITSKSAEAINFKIGDGIINGTGIGQPKGILNSAGRVTVAKEGGQAADTIVKENIDKMWARCHAKFRSNAVWVINQEVETALESLSAVVGTGGRPVYLPAGGIADAPLGRLKGRPVIPLEYCAALGDEGDIMLVDFKQYCSGLKGGIDAAMSMHLRFDYAESVFRFRFEMDGQPWWTTPFTPYKGTGSTLSPYVTLAARA